jgi:hypothetical protein
LNERARERERERECVYVCEGRQGGGRCLKDEKREKERRRDTEGRKRRREEGREVNP